LGFWTSQNRGFGSKFLGTGPSRWFPSRNFSLIPQGRFLYAGSCYLAGKSAPRQVGWGVD
jgi:hypothetical protein